MLVDKVAEMTGSLQELSYILRKRRNPEEKELCAKAAKFLGELMGRALLYSTLGKDEKQDIYSSLANMSTFMRLALSRDDEFLLAYGSHSNEVFKREAWNVMPPAEAEEFCKEWDANTGNRLGMMRGILRLCMAVDEYNTRAYADPESHVFCHRCKAKEIANDILPRIEEVLLPKFKGRRLASALEGFSKHLLVSNSRRANLLERSKGIRNFVDNADNAGNIENWDEFRQKAADSYGCGLVETTALVVGGVLSRSAVADAFDVSEEEIQKLADSLGMKQYVKLVCADEF